MARNSTKNAVIGSICLYGSQRCGHGYLAHLGQLTLETKQYGDGEPVEFRSATSAMWLALEELREAGAQAGKVEVYAPGGEFVALVDLNHPGYFGDLKWQRAGCYVIEAEQLIAAAVS